MLLRVKTFISKFYKASVRAKWKPTRCNAYTTINPEKLKTVPLKHCIQQIGSTKSVKILCLTRTRIRKNFDISKFVPQLSGIGSKSREKNLADEKYIFKLREYFLAHSVPESEESRSLHDSEKNYYYIKNGYPPNSSGNREISTFCIF